MFGWLSRRRRKSMPLPFILEILHVRPENWVPPPNRGNLVKPLNACLFR